MVLILAVGAKRYDTVHKLVPDACVEGFEGRPFVCREGTTQYNVYLNVAVPDDSWVAFELAKVAVSTISLVADMTV